MQFYKPGRFLLTAGVAALALGIGVRQASAQNVIDGFSSHAVTGASDFFISDSVSGDSPIFAPLSTGGDYTINLGSTPTITFGGGTYAVTDVMGIFQLYSTNGNPQTAGNANDQRANTNDVTQGGLTWSKDVIDNSAGKMQAYGWSNGGGTSSNVLTPGHTFGEFDYTAATNNLPNPGPVFFGFDLAVKIGTGQTDPFGNGTAVGGISTGRVYFDAGGGGFVPEPAYYQMASLIGLGGIGLLRLRRRRNPEA